VIVELTPDIQQHIDALTGTAFEVCHAEAPNFGVTRGQFAASIRQTIAKYLVRSSEGPLTIADIDEFFANLQNGDLFLALGCSAGNERAWWEFDQQHRAYMERVARHLASSDLDATEVVDSVYVELYGTRVVDGQRMSKFATYSGRGTLRGWLRTVIWHSIVDLHRAGHDEVSLDEMVESVGEGAAHSAFALESSGESAAFDDLVKERYRAVTVASLAKAFSSLDAHEKLLLAYYHVDGLKLREIARLAAEPSSPLREWFQRRSQTRQTAPAARIHESTVMRWLEKSYARVLSQFRAELKGAHELSEEEIDICVGLAGDDLAGGDISTQLAV